MSRNFQPRRLNLQALAQDGQPWSEVTPLNDLQRLADEARRPLAAYRDDELQRMHRNFYGFDPSYHIAGVHDSLKRAAAHLPRVDAIGGSAAGVYVNNEVRVASLFRGVPTDLFDRHVRRMFFTLQQRWGGVPFEVANDGEVTALAGSMSLGDGAVLGIAMGTSLAAGYVTPEGGITPWLNELAFAPVDYHPAAPRDEWSGDIGCGVQYFSQQGVGRLAQRAGFTFPARLPLPEQLIEVQHAMKAGDARARAIYESIGVCFGYAIAHYADFYEVRNLLVLGRVTSGEGGEIILERATAVLRAEFSTLAESIQLRTPDEHNKRHGQGTITIVDGTKYVGEWKDDKRNGQGTFTYADGTIEEGIWKDGEFLYAQKLPTPAPVVKAPPQNDQIISASFGSGFAVSAVGYVITNNHVIEGCQKVVVHIKGAEIPVIAVTYDPQNDLALLKGNFRPSTVFPLTNNRPELLQDVYVAGFPFGNKVSTSVKVTKGIISSLTGIGNNFSNIQIDAALQSGNSGGPILDDLGNVVGVAVSKLDAKYMFDNFGSIPENTNFGIKSNVVKSIMDSNGVDSPSANRSTISKSQLGKMITEGTYYVSCWMTMAQVEMLRNKKVMFEDLE